MRKRLLFVSLVLALSLALAGSLFASGVGLTGIGARATVLASAYRGISNDWSAMYWNPAGLTQIKGMHFGGNLELISLTGSYQALSPIRSALRTEEVETEPKVYFLPAAGFVYGGEKVSFGISVFAPYGLGAEWDLLDTQGYNVQYPETDLDDGLEVIDIHPSVAIQLSDKISVGLGVSIIHTSIQIRKPVFTPNPYLDPQFQDFANLALNPLGALSPPFDHMISELDMEGDGLGFGGNLGVMFKPTECLSIGVSGRYYLDQPLEGTLNGTAYFMNNAAAHQAVQANMVPTLQALLSAGMITQEQYGVLANMYSGGTYTRYDGLTVKADMPLPLEVGVGIAYSGIQNLLLSLDVDLTQWSSWDIIEFKDESGNKVGELVENWDNAIRIAAGMEYNLGKLKLRAGLYTEPATPPNETMTPAIPEVNRRYSVNVGFGYCLGFGMLHASFEHLFIGDREVTSWEPEYDSEGNQTGYLNMAGTYGLTNNIGMIGFDVHLNK